MIGIISIGLNVMDVYGKLGVMYPGGNEYNVAVYADWQGANSAFLGVFGNDELALGIVRAIRETGVDISHCRYREGENGYAMVELIDGNRVFGKTNQGGVTGKYPIELTENDLSYIKRYDVVSTSINARLRLSEIQKIKAAGQWVSFDFSDFFNDAMLQEFAPWVDYAFLSCGHLDHDSTLALLKKVNALGSRLVIGTRGADGSILYNGHDFIEQPAIDGQIIDTMGAGDAYITAFLKAHTEKRKERPNVELTRKDLSDCMSAATAYATKICSIKGAIGYEMPISKQWLKEHLV